MHMTIEIISPAKAAAYLNHNPSNRPLQHKWVNTLAESIKRGEWELNGEAIKIADDGTVLDGQHRLHGIIKAGTSIQTAIIRDIRRDVFPTLDQGKRRGASDALAIDGHKNAVTLASACRSIYYLESGQFTRFVGRMVSVPQIRDVFVRHPTVEFWVHKFCSSKAKTFITSSMSSVLTLGAERHGQDVAEYFADGMITGVALDSRSPILMLRERMLESRGSGRPLTLSMQCALMVKSWNAYITGKPMGVLRYRPQEEFPLLK